jgi:hypothetical protein
MNYRLASWSGLLEGGFTQQYLEQVLRDASHMWGEGTEARQEDGSYLLRHDGVTNRVYFRDGAIWRTDEV